MENRIDLLNKIKDELANLKNGKGPFDIDEIDRFYNVLLALSEDKEFADHKDQLLDYVKEVSFYRFRYLLEDEFYDFFVNGIDVLLRQRVEVDFIVESIRFFNHVYNDDIENYRLAREKMLGELYKNKSLLTDTKISYESGKEEDGTVKNWFKHYQTYFDHNKDLRLGMLEYMDKNKSIAKLSPEEKLAVRNLIYLVEYLKVPPEELGPREMKAFVRLADGTYAFMDNGDVRVLATESDRLKEYGLVANIWQQNAVNSESGRVVGGGATSNDKNIVLQDKLAGKTDWRQLIQLSENDLMQLKFVSQKYKLLNNEEVLNYFWEGVDSYNEEMVLGAIQELISRQQWDWFFGQTRLKLLLKDFSSRRPNHVPTEDPRFWLQIFFEWILEEHLGMTEERTKKWALYFNNLLLKYDYQQYKGLLSFDKNSQKLQWFQK